jgi:hypothetical protein
VALYVLSLSFHSNGKPTREYVEQTQQRLVGRDGYINITPEILDSFLLDIADFSGHLCRECREMKAMRDNAVSRKTP